MTGVVQPGQLSAEERAIVEAAAAGAPQQTVTPEQISPSDAARWADVGGPHFNQEIQFTILIIIFALVSLGFLYMAARSGRVTEFFLRIYLITIIVFGTLAIVASAYTTEQIAPIVGLFGTIAGYVLGKSENTNENRSAAANGGGAAGGGAGGGGAGGQG